MATLACGGGWVGVEFCGVADCLAINAASAPCPSNESSVNGALAGAVVGAGEGVTDAMGIDGTGSAGVGVEVVIGADGTLMVTAAASSFTLFLMSSSWSGGKLVLCRMPWRSRSALSLF